MSIFNNTFQPTDLKPAEFKDFVLRLMAGYYVDLNQPGHWTKVARADGSGVPHANLCREIAPKLEAWGATLTPKLTTKITTMFKTYGPHLAEDLCFKRVMADA